jgi:hypothetical protein
MFISQGIKQPKEEEKSHGTMEYVADVSQSA